MKKLLNPNPDPAIRLAPRLEELRLSLAGNEPALLAVRTGSEFRGDGFQLHLWEKPIRMTYPGFKAFDAQTQAPLRPDQEMLLLYYFSTSDGTPVTGQFISFADLPGGRFYNQAFQGYTGHELLKVFNADQGSFERAAVALDGRPYPQGDAAFLFHALPSVSLLVVFWQGETDPDSPPFPPSYQILFDTTASHYLPTDAYAILGSTLTRKLIALHS